MNGVTRDERQRQVTHLGSLAHLAAQKGEEAMRAIRQVELDLVLAFELVAEAEEAHRDAGGSWTAGMSAEVATAYKVWQSRVDGELPEKITLPEWLT